MQKQVHNKKMVGTLQKNGRITKKRIPVTSACSPKPETRTIANPSHAKEIGALLSFSISL